MPSKVRRCTAERLQNLTPTSKIAKLIYLIFKTEHKIAAPKQLHQRRPKPSALLIAVSKQFCSVALSCTVDAAIVSAHLALWLNASTGHVEPQYTNI